ncbi:unnamed protein product [Somion occarium]|uniref:Uncharacterized protein n=1 Tax=Somion occarium TaxID=3059160 RepID=A0ABP1CJC1_9APHY
MSFKPINDKDQLRLLKSGVQSKLRSTFKPRYHSRTGSAITLSATDSECSTLVDFGFDNCYSQSPLQTEDERPEHLLEEDNTAWCRGKLRRAQTSSARRRSTHIASDADMIDAEMLDEEDRAWSIPNKSTTKNSRPSSRFFSGISSRYHHTSVRQPGIQSELLDVEDRAWM